MKKFLAWMLLLAICLSFSACAENLDAESTIKPVTTGPSLTREQLLICDVVESHIRSGTYTRKETYKVFMGIEEILTRITNVTHYEAEDFYGVKMDCYLVAVANIPPWIARGAEQSISDDVMYFFVDANTAISYDSISTDAFNVQHDTATEQGRATYLMCLYADIQNGAFTGPYVNESEIVTAMSSEEVAAINKALTWYTEEM